MGGYNGSRGNTLTEANGNVIHQTITRPEANGNVPGGSESARRETGSQGNSKTLWSNSLRKAQSMLGMR